VPKSLFLPAALVPAAGEHSKFEIHQLRAQECVVFAFFGQNAVKPPRRRQFLSLVAGAETEKWGTVIREHQARVEAAGLGKPMKRRLA
jgi:hypothetical protein